MRGVTVELGGKTRELVYDYNALADVEERAGMGIAALFTEERAGYHLIRLLLWGGLRPAEPRLTPARVGDFVQEYKMAGGDLETLMNKVLEALRASGLWEAEPEANPPPGTAPETAQE